MRDLTVIVPVFNAPEVSYRCIRSLLNSDAGDATILIMDDGSDDATRNGLVEATSKATHAQVISHLRNRGYTRNINMGLRMAKTEYVCILNSDTEVPRLWARKLLSVLTRYPHISAVGPLSNAAGYQSVPELFDRNGRFSSNGECGKSVEEREDLSILLSLFFPTLLADVPILNGFCTVFRTDDLRAADMFDIGLFPLGYGEENDLCLRLLARGKRLCVHVGTFVYHAKSQSFGEARKKELSARGSTLLAERYGKTRMDAISRQLQSDNVIALARHVVGRYRSRLGERTLCLNTPSGSEANQQDTTITGTLTSVSGPCILCDDNGQLRVGQADINIESPWLGLSSSLNVSLAIPEDITVMLDLQSLQWSFVVNAAILSHSTTVYIDPMLLNHGECLGRLQCMDLQFGMFFVGNNRGPFQ